ncbi:YybH family protein [Actinomadura gamaensis]|uniref:YybH family protein n=1 Tax=Actinomadura gamaensis TaxID=1763541 RepID=A0ABV9U1B1_9ACTN
MTTTTRRAGEETGLRAHIDKLIAGIGAKDVEALRGLYAPDVVSFDVEPPLQHVGADAKMANWTRAFAFFRDLSYEVRDLAFTVGGDVAFGHCFGRLAGTLPDGTATAGMWVRATFCFERRDGAWLIVHDQASVPFDIATGKGVSDLEP